ncbi:MAG TPA: hypothetical protein VKC90_16080 [Chitinophagaceae bacterium]|nr:hypothetical protein [Chitinophagaceae bacterium]
MLPKLLNRGPNPEVCDATEAEQRTERLTKKIIDIIAINVINDKKQLTNITADSGSKT